MSAPGFLQSGVVANVLDLGACQVFQSSVNTRASVYFPLMVIICLISMVEGRRDGVHEVRAAVSCDFVTITYFLTLAL